MYRFARLFGVSAVLLGVLLACSGISAAEDVWPGFRHDRMHTGRTSYAGPTVGSRSWIVDVGGPISSPVVADGRVYVVGGGSLRCWEINGTLAWTFAINTTGSSTPCVAPDGTIYAGSTDGFLYAVTPAGSQKWKLSLGGAIDASPTLGPDGTIYVGTRTNTMWAVRADKTVKYSYQAGGPIASSAAVATDGTVYFGCDDKKLYALKPDGTFKWMFTDSLVPAAFKSSPSIGDDGTIYIGAMSGAFYAVGPDGKQKWRKNFGAVYSSPAITSDGSLCFGSRDGYVYCLTKTGAERWKIATSGPVDSSPAIDSKGVIYFGSNDGCVYAVNPDGTPAWSCDAGAPVGSSPAVGDLQTLFVTTSDGKLVSIGMDETAPETPIVIDDGAYSSSPNTLHAAWSSFDPESGVAGYEYAIGTAPGAADVVPFTACGLSSEVTRSDLALANAGVYYISVRATNACGLVSEVGTSDGILVDYTPPAVPYVIDDGEFTNATGTLHFVYASGDTESGIARYEYCIGTASDVSCVVGWTDAGLIKEPVTPAITLEHGNIYIVTVRAYNKAGLLSTGKSDGILVDLTAPEVTVSGNASTNEIRATILADDRESGVQAAEWALLNSTSVSADTQWKRIEPGKEFSIPGPFDWKQNYYVAARAQNKAGSWSSAKISAPIRLDITPPSMPIVTDDGKYWGDPTRLHAKWVSQDAESGVKRYSYCVGRSAGAADVVPWTETTADFADVGGLSLANGQMYFFSVRATNGSGLSSAVGVSDGITLDTTPPVVTSVVDDGDYTSSTDTLHAVWTGMDVQSGITEYMFCIGTAPGKDDVASWRSAGAVEHASAGGLSLEAGIKYYFTVKARNGAGLVGAEVCSDGIEYGFGESSWPRFRHDLRGTGCAGVNGPSSPQLRWRLLTAGYVESSAAVSSDGKLYVGCSDGKLYAISTSGITKWTYQTGSCIDSSPAVGPTGCVYFGSYDGYLYCLYPTGALKWKFQAGSMIWSSPAVTDDGTVYFGCQDGCIYSVGTDGTQKWRYATGGAVWSSPSVGADGRIYVGSGDGKLYCLNPNGSLCWAYSTASAIDCSPAIDKNGIVYFGSGDGFVYALNANGSRKWRQYVGRVADASPAVTEDGKIYFGTGVVGSGGALHAFDASGNQLWELDLPGAVRSSPAVGMNGTIYVGCADSRVLAVTPSGGILWQYKADQSVLSSPTIAMDGSLVIGTDSGAIYCLKSAIVGDTTPPSIPMVTVDKQLMTPDSSVKVTWTASDPESGIRGYAYAVGTQPGANDVSGWTDVGPETSVELKGLNILVGQAYYISAIARNGAGMSSGTGSSPEINVVAGTHETSIGSAKKRPEGTKVFLDAVAVTAVYDDCIFVEDLARSSGIRCLINSASVTVGSVVSVSGVISVRYGEKVITNAVLEPVGVAAAVKPLLTHCEMDSGFGLDRTGLLVRIAGRVTRIGSDYILIADGSYAVSPRGAAGIEVRMTPPAGLKVGAMVGVTGVVCREVVLSRLTTIIRAASDPQFVVFE